MEYDFWLYKWIDEFDINGKTDISALLTKNPRSVTRLQEIAASDTLALPTNYEHSESALVAGRDIDLSGDLDCCLDVSKVWEINKDFPRLLHYFDRIIAAGPSADFYAHMLENPTDRILGGISTHIEGLVYVRDIGASDIVCFQPKLRVTAKNYKQLATGLGITNAIDSNGEMIEEFLRHGEIRNLRQAHGHWHFSFRYPALEHDFSSVAWTKKKPTKKKMLQIVFDQYAAFLTSDVATARSMNLPLGSNADLHGAMLGTTDSRTLIDQAALDIYLPVLDGLPLRDVISLRKDEHDHFVQFQASLRAGIKQRLQDSGGDPVAAARAVQSEIMEPALAKIYSRLSGARNSLSKKAGLGVAVGSVLTMVGAIDTIPLIIGTGLAVAATTISAAHKYFDDKKDVSDSDMYFLWLLEKKYRQHHGHGTA